MTACMVFNLVPLSILLRGESILQATKSSLEIMRRTWRKIFVAATVFVTISFTANYIIPTFFVDFFVKELTVQQQLAHPAVWIGNFIKITCILWINSCFLSLYREIKNHIPSKS
jgi:hypothetical protein